MDKRSGKSNPVASLFNSIAHRYDFLNHFLSVGQDVYWRKRQVRGLRVPPGGLVLDLATGTMDVSLEILRHYAQVKILAMDVSQSMLVHGRLKIPEHSVTSIAPVLSDGRSLPLPRESVDSVTISFGIRNITPRARAYAEILRVLKPGGRLSILEFGTGRERIWGGLYNLYLDKLLPVMGRVISRDPGAYRYLAETIKAFPDARSLTRELAEAGFKRIMYQPLSSGIVYLHTAEKTGLGRKKGRSTPGKEDQKKTSQDGGDAQTTQTGNWTLSQSCQHPGHFFSPQEIGDAFDDKGQTQSACQE